MTSSSDDRQFDFGFQQSRKVQQQRPKMAYHNDEFELRHSNGSGGRRPSEHSRTTDEDAISFTNHEKPARLQNPFATPYGANSMNGSRVSFGFSSSTNVASENIHSQRVFRSRRIQRNGADRPWAEKKDPRDKWGGVILLICLIAGLGLAGLLVWDGLRQVPHHTYCVVLDEDWSSGINSKIWTKEVELGGYGNGEFEYTTNTDENVFVQNGALVIKPTLQDENLMTTNNVLNLTAQGICTGSSWTDCWTGTNTTNGSVINPVKSGRINTKAGAKIKYGRVEVVATLPAGDWLWPAIWLLPVNDTYGPWPASGEIDMAESRGNNYTYAGGGGNNVISSTLHWGPKPGYDAWPKTTGGNTAWHSTFPAAKHTFGLEWSENYLYTYVDGKLAQVLYQKFDTPFWAKGDFPPSTPNGTNLIDPWTQTGRPQTPFDQDFYLILNLAVGATNNWFPDGIAQKPWVDNALTARKDFWDARSQWYPTWQANNGGQMLIHSVKMWQQSGYNGC